MKKILIKDDEGEYTDKFRASLLRGLTDIILGKVHSDKEVRKKLGISDLKNK